MKALGYASLKSIYNLMDDAKNALGLSPAKREAMAVNGFDPAARKHAGIVGLLSKAPVAESQEDADKAVEAAIEVFCAPKLQEGAKRKESVKNPNIVKNRIVSQIASFVRKCAEQDRERLRLVREDLRPKCYLINDQVDLFASEMADEVIDEYFDFASRSTRRHFPAISGWVVMDTNNPDWLRVVLVSNMSGALSYSLTLTFVSTKTTDPVISVSTSASMTFKQVNSNLNEYNLASNVALVQQQDQTGKNKPCSIAASDLFKSSYVLTARCALIKPADAGEMLRIGNTNSRCCLPIGVGQIACRTILNWFQLARSLHRSTMPRLQVCVQRNCMEGLFGLAE
jgi:hypothetical protein